MQSKVLNAPVYRCPDCGAKMNQVMNAKVPATPLRFVCKCGKMVSA
jgi:hypothetical protein